MGQCLITRKGKGFSLTKLYENENPTISGSTLTVNLSDDITKYDFILYKCVNNLNTKAITFYTMQDVNLLVQVPNGTKSVTSTQRTVPCFGGMIGDTARVTFTELLSNTQLRFNLQRYSGSFWVNVPIAVYGVKGKFSGL